MDPYSSEAPWAGCLVATGENEIEYEIFKSYLYGPTDSIKEWSETNADTLQRSPGTLQGYAARHRWKARRRAYRAACALVEAEHAADVLGSLAQTRRELNELMGQILLEAMCNVDPAKLTPSEIATWKRILDESSRLEEGEATSIVRVPDLAHAMEDLPPLEALAIVQRKVLTE